MEDTLIMAFPTTGMLVYAFIVYLIFAIPTFLTALWSKNWRMTKLSRAMTVIVSIIIFLPIMTIVPMLLLEGTGYILVSFLTLVVFVFYCIALGSEGW